ncbi:MAG: DUF4058 family protein [Gemmataceae bacterium]
MPLLDHFHPPVSDELPTWESFHSFWAVVIAERLNQMLPSRYKAVVQTHLGSCVEAVVAEFERPIETANGASNGEVGGMAVQTWASPLTKIVVPAVFPDDYEVQLFEQRGGMRLVAVVELVGPRNKDRAESCRAFAVKCAAYLQRGVGLIVVDIVAGRHFNLHNELAELLVWEESLRITAACFLYAEAYRPLRRQEKNEIDIWPVSLNVGGSLPLLPLALKGTQAIPLDLESTYTDARQRSRL